MERQDSRSFVLRIFLALRKEVAVIFLVTTLVFLSLVQNENSVYPAKQNLDRPGRVKGLAYSPHLKEIKIGKEKYQQNTTLPVVASEEETTSDDRLIFSAGGIIEALNSYRLAKGVGGIPADSALMNYAQERASFFASRGSMDGHAGFQDFINNRDGFNKLGFFALGENSSYGHQLSAKELIEVVFSADAPHENNQLNPEWTHVGVGVAGGAVDIVFGGRKR